MLILSPSCPLSWQVIFSRYCNFFFFSCVGCFFPVVPDDAAFCLFVPPHLVFGRQGTFETGQVFPPPLLLSFFFFALDDSFQRYSPSFSPHKEFFLFKQTWFLRSLPAITFTQLQRRLLPPFFRVVPESDATKTSLPGLHFLSSFVFLFPFAWRLPWSFCAQFTKIGFLYLAGATSVSNCFFCLAQYILPRFRVSEFFPPSGASRFFERVYTFFLCFLFREFFF